MDSQLEPFDNALRKVTKGNRIADGATKYKSQVDWGEFITPAPYCISLLGQLLFISANQDFSIENGEPKKGGFKFIENPKSFQACMVQLASKGARAFHTANKNMGGIYEHSGNYESHVKAIVSVLLQGEDQDVEDIVPTKVLALESMTEECVRLAEETEKAFNEVTDLTEELLMASSSVKGDNEQKKGQIEANLKSKNEMRTRMENQKKELEQRKQKTEDNWEDAKKMYNKAVDSIPSGWDMIALSTVEALSGTLNDGLSAAMMGACGGKVAALAMLEKKLGGGKGGQGQESDAASAPQAAQPSKAPELDAAYNKSNFVVCQLILLDSLVDSSGGKIDWGKVKDNIEAIRAQIQTVKDDLKPETIPSTQLFDYCGKIINLCAEFKKNADSLNPDETAVGGLKKNLSSVKTDVTEFNAKAKVIMGSQPAAPSPIFTPQASNSKGGGGAAQAQKEAAHFKVHQMEMSLTNARQDHKAATDKLDDVNEKLINLVGELSKLSFNNVEYDKIRTILISSIKYLSLLSEAWSNLVMFFQMITNIIKITLKSKVSSFVSEASVGEKRRLANVSLSDILKDLLYRSAIEVASVALHIRDISGTYMEISTKYLVPTVSGITGILGLDLKKDEAEAIKQKNALVEKAKEAQELVKKRVKESQAEYDRNIAKRLDVISKELKSTLPAINPEIQKMQTKAIEQAEQMSNQATAAAKVVWTVDDAC